MYNLVWFYGISALVRYLLPNPLNTYELNIYGLVWFGSLTYQTLEVIHCQILFIHIY